MSKATSIRGERYGQNFRAGFVRKNATHMRNRKFKADGGDVFGINKRGKKADRIGDIDGYYISTSQKLLRDLLPCKHQLGDQNFVIKEGAHIFFELIWVKDLGSMNCVLIAYKATCKGKLFTRRQRNRVMN